MRLRAIMKIIETSKLRKKIYSKNIFAFAKNFFRSVGLYAFSCLMQKTKLLEIKISSSKTVLGRIESNAQF